MGSGEGKLVAREKVAAADVANLEPGGVDIASIANELLHLSFTAYL